MMFFEAVAAGVVGLLAVWLVLDPLIRTTPAPPVPYEPPDPLETRQGQALAALREIEFDRETGKLSDPDYEALRSRYTQEVLHAMRSEGDDDGADPIERMVAARVRAIRGEGAGMAPGDGSAPGPLECPSCGPRPEPDAVYCSSCGRTLVAGDRCTGCGAQLTAGGRFCGNCGTQVAA